MGEEMKTKKKIFLLCVIGLCTLVTGSVYAITKNQKYVKLVASDLGDSILEVEHNYKSIFEEAYQKKVTKKIENKVSKKKYTLENPLLLYNPYGTNTLALNIYFSADVEGSLSYTIIAEGTEDFSKTAVNDTSLKDTYAYQIIGLVPGKENTITFTFTEKDGTKKTKTVKIQVPKLTTETDLEIDVQEGESTEEITDGLFAVLGHDKNFNANIYLFDNAGTIRSELVLDGYRADRIEFIDDCMLYSISTDQLVMVNRLGEVVKQYHLDNYKMHHDYMYDENTNQLLILASSKNGTTIEDKVISLDLKTSVVKELLDMKNYVQDLYKNAVNPGKNAYGTTALDWVHLNSIALEGDNIILSSRELSTIIKIDSIYTNPTLNYIITDDSVLENTNLKDKNLTKIGDFVSQAGQHAVTYSKEDGMEDGTYYLSMFNNNYKTATTRPDFDWSVYPGTGTYLEGEQSYYYKYLVNEKNHTYTLVESISLPYSSIVSSVQSYQNHLVTSSGLSNEYRELDAEGKLIRSYTYSAKKYAYRVFKYTFDNFWFS